MSAPEAVLHDLRDAWHAALPDWLRGLYVHGSLTAGDFAAHRSDLDLLAVSTADPDERLLDVLAGLHRDLDRRHPAWAGRIEVEYVSLDAIRAAAAARTGRGHLIARISPGEPLHLLPATTHRLVTWSTVRERGHRLSGPPPDVLLPAVDPALVRSALLDHVRDWPDWVRGMTTPGAQAYSVLTLCRAEQRLLHGRQLSKLRAADRTADAHPEWADLITWARDWWYGPGSDADAGRVADVREFVVARSAAVLAATEGGRPPP